MEKKHINMLFWMIVIIVIIMGFSAFSYGIYKIEEIKKDKHNKVANKHIQTAMMTEKACSSCHIGYSFVNLMNNELVKSNDNVVFYILDDIKVKRW